MLGIDADAQEAGKFTRQSRHPALFPVGSHGKYLIGQLLDDPGPVGADDGEDRRRSHDLILSHGPRRFQLTGSVFQVPGSGSGFLWV